MTTSKVTTSEPVQAVYVTAVEVHAVPIQAEVISSQPYGHQEPLYFENGPVYPYGPPANGPPAFGPPAYGSPAFGPPAYGPTSHAPVSHGPAPYRPNYSHNNNGFNPPLFQQGQVGPVMRQQFGYRGSIGTCRGCGRQFERPPNSHESNAQYYRCENCNEFRVDAFLCTIS